MPLDPATRHTGQETVASKIARADTLGALKIRAGTGEGMPDVSRQLGDAFRRFSAELGLGADILSGVGAHEMSRTVSRLRAEARLETGTGSE